MKLQRLIGLIILAAGVVLLIYGIRATDSFGSQFSKFFTGSPTDKAIWLTLGGVAMIVGGAAAAIRPCRAC